MHTVALTWACETPVDPSATGRSLAAPKVPNTATRTPPTLVTHYSGPPLQSTRAGVGGKRVLSPVTVDVLGHHFLTSQTSGKPQQAELDNPAHSIVIKTYPLTTFTSWSMPTRTSTRYTGHHFAFPSFNPPNRPAPRAQHQAEHSTAQHKEFRPRVESSEHEHDHFPPKTDYPPTLRT